MDVLKAVVVPLLIGGMPSLVAWRTLRHNALQKAMDELRTKYARWAAATCGYVAANDQMFLHLAAEGTDDREKREARVAALLKAAEARYDLLCSEFDPHFRAQIREIAVFADPIPTLGDLADLKRFGETAQTGYAPRMNGCLTKLESLVDELAKSRPLVKGK